MAFGPISDLKDKLQEGVSSLSSSGFFSSLFPQGGGGFPFREVSGVDISSSGIKIITARKSADGINVTRSLFSPLPSFKDDEERRKKRMLLLSRLLEDEEIEPDSMILTLPAGEVSYRIVKLPFTNRHKINALLAFELEKYIPFHLDEVAFGSMVLETDREKGETSLLVASCSRVILAEELRSLADAGINPVGISTRATGIALSLLLQEQENLSIGASALLDVGEEYSVLAIQSGGVLKSLHTHDAGSSSLRTKEGAEELLRFIQLALFAYQREYPDAPLKRLLLSGEGRSEPVLRDALVLLENLEVKEWSFFSPRFSVEGFQPGSVELPLFSVSLGLAVGTCERGEVPLNFRTGEYAFKSDKREYAALFKRVGVLSLLLLLLLGVDVLYKKYTLEARLNRITKEIRSEFHRLSPETRRVVNEVAQLETKLREIKARQRNIASFAGVKGQFLEGFAEMNKALTGQDAELLSLRYSDETLRFEAETSSFEGADRIKNTLTEVPFFKRVVLEDMRLDRQRNRVRVSGTLFLSEREGEEG